MFRLQWVQKITPMHALTCSCCGAVRSLVCPASQTTTTWFRHTSYSRLVSIKNLSCSQFKRLVSTTKSTPVGPNVSNLKPQHGANFSKLKQQHGTMKDLAKSDKNTNSRITVYELSQHLGIPPGKLKDILEDMGQEIPSLVAVVPSKMIDFLCREFDKLPLIKKQRLVTRPPVVTIMGHVDHGKTTLLDALRNTSVAAGEAGGITQHIGAFIVKLPTGGEITFIDTPGHAAFESMRARGANVTDIVVLVVAADEGVKTQTVESIKHAVHAKVPMIVAINKIDKGKKSTEFLKHQLLTHGIQLEEFSGDVQAVEVSALKGINLDGLIEAILTLAEVNDLKADNDADVQGVVLESKKAKGLGPVATALVQGGTLGVGDIIVAGSTFAKVRQMYSDQGQAVSEAPPSTPVQVTGWRDQPTAGEKLFQVQTEGEARKIASKRKAIEDQRKKDAVSKSFSLDSFVKEGWQRIRTARGEYDATNKLDVVIKGDVDGSVEAVVDAIKTYKCDKIKLSILHTGVGAVSENDIKTASSFKGVLLCFNVSIPKDMEKLANQMKVKILNQKIIYKLLEDLKGELSGRLPELKREQLIGEAEILKVFKLTGTKKAWVAGCRVKQGVLNKSNQYRIVRADEAIFEGKLTSLKRGQDDVDVVKKEQECGLSLENFTDFKEGDRVHCFQVNIIPDEVDWEWGF